MNFAIFSTEGRIWPGFSRRNLPRPQRKREKREGGELTREELLELIAEVQTPKRLFGQRKV